MQEEAEGWRLFVWTDRACVLRVYVRCMPVGVCGCRACVRVWVLLVWVCAKPPQFPADCPIPSPPRAALCCRAVLLPCKHHNTQPPTEELPHGTAWRGVEAARAALVASGGAADLPMRLQKYQLRKEAELQDANIKAFAVVPTAAAQADIK